MNHEPVMKPGENCRGVYRVRRLGICLDTASYFAAFHDALMSAKRSVTIIGWDLHSGVRLKRGERDEVTLMQALTRATEKNPRLEIRVLVWEGLAYRYEREWFQELRFSSAERVQFVQDATMPPTACSHIKLVVVDDALAFTGGIDLAHERWDRREHDPSDELRTAPGGRRYPPFHDVQLVLTGEIATRLAALARDRWEAVTGEDVPRVGELDTEWPDGVMDVLEEGSVALALTVPPWAGDEIRDVERAYIDLIESAEETIYIESQYMTSETITRALARALRRPDPPEVVIVTPARGNGWLEGRSIEPLRKRATDALRAADEHDRLRVICPVSGGARVFVHAKVCIVDDRLLRVGSANLTNRSMGVDLEADLVVEARNEADRRAISRLRDELLGTHVGEGAIGIAARRERHRSLVELVDEAIEEGVLESVEFARTSALMLPLNLVDPQDIADAADVMGAALTPSRHATRAPRNPLEIIAVGGLAVLGAWATWRLVRRALTA